MGLPPPWEAEHVPLKGHAFCCVAAAAAPRFKQPGADPGTGKWTPGGRAAWKAWVHLA
jgi:hypothetical protein